MSGYRPGLSQRFRSIAATAVGSSDANMRNAAAMLAASRDDQELVSWVKIVVDNCRQAAQPSGAKVFQPATPTVATPGPPATGSGTRVANENAEAIRKLTEQYRKLGDVMRDTKTSLPAPPAPPLAPRVSPTTAPPKSTSPEEADRQLRGVLEREGATGATCTKKQYGGSWVMICE